MSSWLASVCQIVAALHECLAPTLGPHARDLVVRTATDHILLTNNAATVLSNITISHPIGSIVMKHMRSHNDSEGDGSSTIIIMAHAMCLSLTKLLRERGVRKPLTNNHQQTTDLDSRYLTVIHTVLRALHYLDIQLSSTGSLYHRLLSLSVSVSVDDRAALLSVSQQMIVSQLSTSFNANVARHLSSLAVQLLSHALTAGLSFHRATSECRSDSCYTRVVGASVSECCLVNGIVVDKTIARNGMASIIDAATVVVLLTSIEPNTEGAVIQQSTAEQYEKLLVHSEAVQRRVIDGLVSGGCNLVVSSYTMSEFALSLCCQHGVSVLHGVERGLALRVARALSIEPVYRISDSDNMALGHCSLKLMKLSKRLASLITPDQSSHTRSRSVLLSMTMAIAAPNDGLAVQFQQALRRVFATLHQSTIAHIDSDSGGGDSVRYVGGGGSVELALGFHCQSQASQHRLVNDDTYIAYQLLASALLSVPQSLYDNATMTRTNSKFFRLLPLARTLCLSQHRHASQLGLLAVNNPMSEQSMIRLSDASSFPSTVSAKELSVLSDVECSLLELLPPWLELTTTRDAGLIESLALKLHSLQSVVQLFTTLLRITGWMQVKRSVDHSIIANRLSVKHDSAQHDRGSGSDSDSE